MATMIDRRFCTLIIKPKPACSGVDIYCEFALFPFPASSSYFFFLVDSDCLPESRNRKLNYTVGNQSQHPIANNYTEILVNVRIGVFLMVLVEN